LNYSIFLLKIEIMSLQVEDLNDESRFRHLMTLSYDDIAFFVIEYIRRKSVITIFFWSVCLIFLGISIVIRINIAGYYKWIQIFYHSLIGIILLPIVIIPVHEFLHAAPFFITGARNIRVGADLRQFIFYVTVHRQVITPGKFKLVAWFPFVTVSIISLVLIYFLPGLWKWSLSLFLFVHATMCAGDIGMLNFYYINRPKKILSWDDVDKREAYFYEET